MLVGPRSTKELTYGMSIGFDLLISGFEERGLPHVVIDRSKGMVGRKVGAFSPGGILATVSMLISYCLNLLRVAGVYLTIGTSRAGFLRDMLMIWPAWLFRKRIILHLKGGGYLSFYEASPGWLKYLLRHTINRATTIIVLGNLLRDQFQFIPDISKRLVVVPNGLPRELENNSSARTIGNQQEIRLLYLSNMIPSKGYLDVLEACRILHRERQISIRGDFCGAFVETVNDSGSVSAAEAESNFRRLVEEMGLEQVVHYHGTVRDERKRKMLEQAHLLILPTSYPWEGQPISIIEAMAYALPVLATHYRGIPEQVIHGYNGFLLDKGSPEEIADRVEELWCNQSLYEEFSRHALRHFEEHFTRDAHLNRLIPVILGR